MRYVIIAKQKLIQHFTNCKTESIIFLSNMILQVKMIKNQDFNKYGLQSNKNEPYLGAKKVGSIMGDCCSHAFITFLRSCFLTNTPTITIFFIVASLIRFFDNSSGGS